MRQRAWWVATGGAFVQPKQIIQTAWVPVHSLCWFWSKSKYALGMRWTFFRPRTRLTYAPEVEPTLNQQESNKNLAGIRQKFVDIGCILV